jgi:hypothetical protein
VWPPPLTSRLASDADSTQVAQAVGDLWGELEEALHPVIGKRGVAALYNRSLHLSAAAAPWLAAGYAGSLVAMNTDVVKANMAHRPAEEAARGGVAHLQSFHGLLTSLVGPMLTERLLRSVWTTPSVAQPPQDTAP